MTSSNTFKDQLLEQLKEDVARRPTPAAPPPHRAFGTRQRARLVLAVGGCAAALAAVLIFGASGDVASKAYAVTPQPSGLVKVSIHSLEDGAGLQKSLREAGVPVVVEFNHRSDLPPLRDYPGVPYQFRDVIPSQGSVGCIGRLPELGPKATLELPYPESLAPLAGVDHSLRPTLLKGAKRVFNPGGLRGFLHRQKKFGYDPDTAKYPPIPPFAFIPGQDLVPPAGEKEVTFIVDPDGLEPGESLHIVTTNGDLQSMTAFSNNAVCLAGGA